MKKLQYNYKTGVVSIKPSDSDVFFAVGAPVIKDHSLVYVEESDEYALIIDLDCTRILIRNVRPDEDELLTKFIKTVTIKVANGRLYL